jgi:hypothetical protein
MLNMTHTLRTPAAGALAALALASFALTGCGESSGGDSSQSSTAVKKALAQIAKARSVSSGTTKAPQSSSGNTAHSVQPQITGVRACLEKSGAIPPKSASHSLLTDGSALKGAKRAQFAAALRKCLSVKPSGKAATGATAPRPARASRLKQALEKYAACLRQNGVPTSKSSGKGIVGLQGLDRSSPHFKSAALKCRTVLATALRGGL